MTHSSILIKLSFFLHLLDLCSCGSKKLNVSAAYDLLVLLQGLLPIPLLLEQDKSIPGGSPIWFLDEQNSVIFIQDVARIISSVEKVDLQKSIVDKDKSFCNFSHHLFCRAIVR